MAPVVNCVWGAKPNALAIMKGVEGCASILATFDSFSCSALIEGPPQIFIKMPHIIMFMEYHIVMSNFLHIFHWDINCLSALRL